MVDAPPALPTGQPVLKTPGLDIYAPTAEQRSAAGLDQYAPVSVAVQDDIVKAFAPSVGRGVVQAATGIPTLLDMGADAAVWGAEKAAAHDYLGPEKLKAIKGGAETAKDYLKPLTYGSVMGKIQDDGLLGLPPTGKWYEPQTVAGKIAMAPVELLPSMAFGGGGGVGAKVLRAGFGGVLGEGGGQAAEALGFENAAPWIKAAGTLGGVAYGPSIARNRITPHPQEANHADAVKLLQSEGVRKKDMTAGAYTGSPKLLQREANLSTPGNLEAIDTNAFMRVLANKSGMPGNSQISVKAVKEAEDRFNTFNKQIDATDMSPTNFANLQKEGARLRRLAMIDMHNSGKAGPTMQNIDEILTQFKGGAGAQGMPGSRYEALRSDIQRRIGESINKVEKEHLGNLRRALDDQMGKEFPAGALKQHHDEYANFNLITGSPYLTDAKRQMTPAQMQKTIHEDPGWGAKAYSQGRGLSEVTQAGHRVLGNRPVGKYEPGPVSQLVSTGIGAGVGNQYANTSGEAIIAALIGRQMAPVVQGGGKLLAKGAHFNPIYQGYLKNQLWQPGAGSDVSKAMAARLLAGPVPANLQQRGE